MRALVGHTGFVGGNLAAQTSFDAFFNSRNIESIAGGEYELAVCAAAPAEKWKANRDPETDRASIRRLTECLSTARIDRLVLISTVDVYATPIGVDETDPTRADEGTAYGRHRRELERFAEQSFHCTILRLPALFGPGLRKNAVYDLLHGNEVEKIDSRAAYQFYDLSGLWEDIGRILDAGITLANLATPPVGMHDVAAEAFGMDFVNHVADRPPRYDFQTIHASLRGRTGRYLYDLDEVLGALRSFVAEERRRSAGDAGA